MVVRLKTKRMRRYLKLVDAGFMPFEARGLSRIPFTVPYMGGLLRARHIRYTWARKKGLTDRQYAKAIRQLYLANDWIKLDKAGRRRGDPWKLLREFEDRYREKHPEYQSPGEKRRRRFRRWEGDYISKKYRSDEEAMGRGR